MRGNNEGVIAVLLVAAVIATTVDAQCIGEFQSCPKSGDCVYIPSDCGKCGAGMYMCPSRKDCAAHFEDCPGLKGTFWDWTLTVDARVELLADATNMTEQISQLWHNAPAIERLGIPSYNWLNDDEHGLRRKTATSFPNGPTLGATFAADTLKQIGEAIAQEARATHHYHINAGERGNGKGNWNGIGLTLYAPNMNLVRDPRWGRSQEVYSEDPCLSSELTEGFVTGVQTTKGSYLEAAACCKHYAVYDLESNPIARYFYNAQVDGRNLWESYLPVFEACVRRSKAAHVMCSYNAVNGIPACAHSQLMNDVLRSKWSFKGFVVSDYDAWAQIFMTHGYCKNMTCAAATGINAGMDQEGGGHTAIDKLQEAVQLGLVTKKRIREAFSRLFRIRFMLGMLDPPSMVPFANVSHAIIADPAHMELNLKAAREGVCLFKNEKGVLPLHTTASGRRIAVIGPKAAATAWLQGNYAQPPRSGVVSILEGIANTNCQQGKGCGVCEHDDHAVDYSVPNETIAVPARDAGECCQICNSDLSCNYWTLNEGHCFLATDFLAHRPLPGVGAHSGCRTGLCTLEPGVSYAQPTDASVTTEDERECCARCRANTTCSRFTFEALSKQCYLLPTASKAAASLTSVSGTSSTKNPLVTFEPACMDGVACNDVSGFTSAANAAAAADDVVVVLGLDQSMESEGHDRATIDLPENQYKLVALLRNITKAKGTALIGVFVHGGSIAFGSMLTDLDAILDAWYPSQQGGTAVAQVLFGMYSPAGRSPVTFYSSNKDLPATLAVQDFYPNETYHGLTYRYFNAPVEIPFGFGLSYTSWKYENLVVSPTTITDPCSVIEVQVDVMNVGDVFGDEVVQCYLQQKNKTILVPQLRLAAFTRVREAAPKAVIRVKLSVHWRYRTAVAPSASDPIIGSRVVLPPGKITLFVGGGQPSHSTAGVSVDIDVLHSGEADKCPN